VVKHRFIVYRAEDLKLGFIGRSCSFEHRARSERSPEAIRAYIKLAVDLRKNGMKHPLITYKGSVLVGMRRYEIMKGCLAEFNCVEILESVEDWLMPDIKRLSKFKDLLYGAGTVQAFTG